MLSSQREGLQGDLMQEEVGLLAVVHKPQGPKGNSRRGSFGPAPQFRKESISFQGRPLLRVVTAFNEFFGVKN